jgi:hypothetical protein
MSLDDRDYMRNRRFSMSEREKQRQIDSQKARFTRYTNATKVLGAPRVNWRKVIFWSVCFLVVIGVMKKLPEITSAITTHGFWFSQQDTPFPRTGEVRWFIPVSKTQSNTAHLAITGLRKIGQNSTVKLDDWATHAPIAMIPIRGGETATLNVPLGRYRVMFSSNASWQGEIKMGGGVQEAVDPLEFYQTGNQVVGRTIDLNGRLNGNMKTKPASFF